MLKTSIKVAMYLVVAALVISPCLIGNAMAITNGVPDGDTHPYVGLIVFFDGDPMDPSVSAWFCTGFLISPTVMVCAGHCTYGAVYAGYFFDPAITPGTIPDKWAIGIHTHPDFKIFESPTLKGWISHDVGVIILSKSIELDDYASLPEANTINALPMKQDIDLIGYGVNFRARGGGQPVWVGGGTRMQASAQLINSRHAMSDEFVRMTQNPGQDKGGTSFGDSGGPALLAGTDTVIALTSWGTNYNSAGVGYYTRLDLQGILTWINGFLN